MSIVKGEWADINVIASEAAQLERKFEDSRFPQHPRTDVLEADLRRAIRIMNDAGFTVVREIKEKDEKIAVAVSMIGHIPKGMTKDSLKEVLASLTWFGHQLFRSENIEAKLIIK